MTYYPCRCRIVDVEGLEIFGEIMGKTPEDSQPHVGKEGIATLDDDGISVTIALDDGTILYGHECWGGGVTEMNRMAYIRKFYKIPARRGMWVNFKENPHMIAKIVGTNGAYLKVRYEGDTGLHLHHPLDFLYPEEK